jgi:hypothetical protein
MTGRQSRRVPSRVPDPSSSRIRPGVFIPPSRDTLAQLTRRPEQLTRVRAFARSRRVSDADSIT